MGSTTIHDLYRQLVSKQIDRRAFIRGAAALGVTASGTSMFLRAADARAQADPVPVVAQPCEGDACLFAGQTLTAQCIDDSVKLPWEGVRAEFEAAALVD